MFTVDTMVVNKRKASLWPDDVDILRTIVVGKMPRCSTTDFLLYRNSALSPDVT